PADARRRGSAHGGLLVLVAVRRPFHPLPLLLLRLRLRRAASDGAGAEAPAGGRSICAALPRHARCGWLGGTARAAAQAWRGCQRSRVLGAGAETAGWHGDGGARVS